MSSDIPVLPAAVPGERHVFASRVGRLCYYISRPQIPSVNPPLLLVHSVNAAASAYEMSPLFKYYSASRCVCALELPGFGGSERSDRTYSVRLMTDAVHEILAEIQKHCGDGPIDAAALSLSCEFLARAATEHPDAFRSLAMISPTAFNRRSQLEGKGHRGMPILLALLRRGPWRRVLFNGLTSRAIIRYFLNKTWGSRNIDEGLLDYDWITARQPGARHAPYFFVSGFLFSRDAPQLYRALPQPIWMVHGNKGDFTDYSRAAEVAALPNWRVQPMRTGALPHFENFAEFVAGYDAFLAALPQSVK